MATGHSADRSSPVNINLSGASLPIDPESFYAEQNLRMQGIDGEVLRKAAESGALRYRRIGRTRVYKGQWLIEWLGAADTDRRA